MRRFYRYVQVTMVVAIMLNLMGSLSPAMARQEASLDATPSASEQAPVAPEAPTGDEAAAPDATEPIPAEPIATNPAVEETEEAPASDDVVAGPTVETPASTVVSSTPEPTTVATEAPTETPDSRMKIQATGCGSAPYPAPSGSLLTNAIDSVTANPTELDSNWSTFDLSIAWSLKSAGQGGDYFTLPLPDEIGFDTMFFEMRDSSGNVVACASVIGGTATFTLTSYVEGKSNVRGTASFSAWLDDTGYTEPTTIPVSFGGYGTITFTVPGDYEDPGPSEPDPWAWKSGWFANSDQGYTNGRHALEWMIHLPASQDGFTNVVVTDVAQDNWTFSCSSPWSANEVIWLDGDIDFDVDCSSQQLTVSIPSIPANVNVELYFYADIQAGEPGPFNNTFSATGFESQPVGDSHAIVRSTGGGDGSGDTIANPVVPTVQDGVCVGGEWTAPSVTIADGNGITYQVNLNQQTGAYTITATKSGDQTWGNLNSTGWTVNEDNSAQAIYSGTVDLNPCDIIIPVIPTVNGNVCTGGAYTPPTIVAENGNGITYVTGAVNMETGAYTVTATLSGANAWGTMPQGWTITSATTALYNGTVELAPCAAVVPVIPSVSGNVCEGGAYIPAVVAVNDTTSGITYDISTVNPTTGAYTVVATLASGQTWGTMPAGWDITNATTATYNGSVEMNPCVEVAPATPAFTDAVCTGGALIDPTVTPGTTAGITYTIEGEIVAGNTVTVTAALANGYEWGEMPLGWMTTSATTATFAINLDDVQCIPVVPVMPEVTQAVCTGGALVPPTVTTSETEGITYTLDGGIAPGATVIVTATLADGFAWGEMAEGWTIVDGTTATAELTLEDVACEQVIPATPLVNQAVCTTGALVDPIVTLQETNGIVYSTEGEIVSGGTVVVTATLEDGHAWSEMPEGWTKIDNTTAVMTIVLDNVSCTEVVPVDPSVTNAVCVDGGLTDADVTTPATKGVTYSFDTEAVINGGTFVIEATLADGYAWGEMPQGWTRVNDTTATFTVTLENVECITVDPSLPANHDAVCEDGTVRNPELTFPETPGLSYSIEGDQVPGGTVIVTATLEDGFAWGKMPEGWTMVDATTATYEHTFDSVTCEMPEAPQDPKQDEPTVGQPEVKALPSTGSGTSTTSNAIWMMLAASLLLGAAGHVARLRVTR